MGESNIIDITGILLMWPVVKVPREDVGARYHNSRLQAAFGHLSSCFTNFQSEMPLMMRLVLDVWLPAVELACGLGIQSSLKVLVKHFTIADDLSVPVTFFSSTEDNLAASQGGCRHQN